MHRRVHETFRPVRHDPPDPLLLHGHPEEADNVVIFVHGLGGSRCGRKPTWGRIPELIFDRNENVDVGLYGYRSLFGRLKFWESISIQDESRVFADCLRDQLEGKSIILVGHSLGGLVCKGAIGHLLESGQAPLLSRIRGLFLMASPQAGALGVPFFGPWLSKDLQVLRAHNPFVRKLDQQFTDFLDLTEGAPAPGRIGIPTWAVSAASDMWVDALSSQLGLPSSQTKLIRGSHTSFVKPTGPRDDGYRFMEDRIQRVFAQPGRSSDAVIEPMADLPPLGAPVGGGESPPPIELPEGDVEMCRVEARIEGESPSSNLVVDVTFFPLFLASHDGSQEPIQCGCKVASTSAIIEGGDSQRDPEVEGQLRGGAVVIEHGVGPRPRLRMQAGVGDVLDGRVRLGFPIAWNDAERSATVTTNTVALGIKDGLAQHLGKAGELLLGEYLRRFCGLPVSFSVDVKEKP